LYCCRAAVLHRQHSARYPGPLETGKKWAPPTAAPAVFLWRAVLERPKLFPSARLPRERPTVCAAHADPAGMLWRAVLERPKLCVSAPGPMERPTAGAHHPNPPGMFLRAGIEKAKKVCLGPAALGKRNNREPPPDHAPQLPLA